jgi:hypothetical protein
VDTTLVSGAAVAGSGAGVSAGARHHGRSVTVAGVGSARDRLGGVDSGHRRAGWQLLQIWAATKGVGVRGRFDLEQSPLEQILDGVALQQLPRKL